MSESDVTASQLGLCTCHGCGGLSELIPGIRELRCRRCGAALHLRKPRQCCADVGLTHCRLYSLHPGECLADDAYRLLVRAQSDTIMSGVVYLWHSGSWHIALVVFIASIVVPLAKMLSLTYLLITVQLGWTQRSLERTKLYRILEFVGPWSMLDVYVVLIPRGARPTERACVDSTGPGGGGVRRRGGSDDVCRDDVRSAAALESQGVGIMYEDSRGSVLEDVPSGSPSRSDVGLPSSSG